MRELDFGWKRIEVEVQVEVQFHKPHTKIKVPGGWLHIDVTLEKMRWKQVETSQA